MTDSEKKHVENFLDRLEYFDGHELGFCNERIYSIAFTDDEFKAIIKALYKGIKE